MKLLLTNSRLLDFFRMCVGSSGACTIVAHHHMGNFLVVVALARDTPMIINRPIGLVHSVAHSTFPLW